MITLPLKDMSLNEKFIAIEMIWDDICHNSSDFRGIGLSQVT